MLKSAVEFRGSQSGGTRSFLVLLVLLVLLVRLVATLFLLQLHSAGSDV